MGHRSEKKSHKHKHHRRHKSLKKETSKQQHLEVRESEPESGEILGELVGLDATLSRQNALLLQLRPDSCAFKENEGEAQPAPEANQHPSTLPNNEGATPLKASNSDKQLGRQQQGDKGSHAVPDEGVAAPAANGGATKAAGNENGGGVASILGVTAGSPTPSLSLDAGKVQLSKPVTEREVEQKKHRRSLRSPASDKDVGHYQVRSGSKRKSSLKKDTLSRSRSRSSDKHPKLQRTRLYHGRARSPALDSGAGRRRPRSRSSSRNGREHPVSERPRSSERIIRRDYYSEKYRQRRRPSPDHHHRRRRRSNSGGRRSKRSKRSREGENSEDDELYRARVKAALAEEMEEVDEEKLLEERRRKRQEILNKYKKQNCDMQEDIYPPALESEASPLIETCPPPSTPSEQLSPSEVVGVSKSEESRDGMNSGSQLSQSIVVVNEDAIVQDEMDMPSCSREKAAEPVDDGDIFCDTPDTSGRKLAVGLDEAVRKASFQKGLTDSYDDPEGYYNFQIGEILDNRYEVFASKGKGVFSTVLRARDKGRRNANDQHPEVAIKMIRSNDMMRKSGQTEEEILKLLACSDPENKRHCIRLLRSFEYRGHLCLVFEPMAMNLRELTNKFGRKVGLNIDAVGLYTAQLLVALNHLKSNKILHADIKPDNILVNEKFSRVKLCDFGSAMRQGDVEVTPYLVSRFYRSPEVILGLPYDHPMDTWSIGCVIYELFTGKILYPGKTNNEMLKLMMEVKGPFPKKMLKRGEFAEKHFEADPNMSFIQYDDDPVTKKPIKRLIVNPTVKNDFSTLLLRNSLGSKRKMVLLLADLMEKMMMLDPDRRINLDMALRHPFVRHYLQRNKPESSHLSKPAPRKC